MTIDASVQQMIDAALAAHVATYHAPPPVIPATPAGNTAPGVTVTPEAWNILGDGSDETAKLQRAFDELNGRTLVLNPARKYGHAGLLDIRSGFVWSPGVRVGNRIVGGAELASLNPAQSSVRISGDNVRLRGFVLSSKATVRSQDDVCHKLFNRAKGAVIDQVQIDGSAGAGMYSDFASDYTITDIIVLNTMADGVHNTSSRRALISRPYCENVGDDGVAVVSYFRPNRQVPCSDITVDRPVVRNGKARGVACVGGKNITFSNVDIDGTQAAGIYISREPSFNSWGTDGCNVAGGTVRNANARANTHHGAVFFYGEDGNRYDGGPTPADQTVRNSSVRNLDVYPLGAGSNTPWYVGGRTGASLVGCVIDDIRIHATDRVPSWTDTGGLQITNTRRV